MNKRIALINSWPNLPASAEREFIARFVSCAQLLGYDASVCITSDDVLSSRPLFALPLHEFTPKLTGVPTLGPMWSPPEYYRNDDDRIRSILSYDGYLTGSDVVTSFLQNIWFSTQSSKPISSFYFLPTSAKTNVSISDFSRMFYAGVHWDGKRHGDLISKLSSKDLIDVYGPPASWKHVSPSYRGELPFDGKSLFPALANSGIALALHSEAHLRANTPSMRMFEAASVGCAIIADDMKFTRDVFGDTVYLVTENDAEARCEQISHFIDEIKSAPKVAYERARAAREIFERDWSLNVMIPKIFDFAHDVRDREGYNRASCVDQKGMPKVSVCIRTGGRNLQFLERALLSVLYQTYPCIEVVVVDYAHRADIQSAVSDFKRQFENSDRNVVYVKGRQTRLRSTAIFDGLSASTGHYFSLLDDDDELFVNNFAVLVRSATESGALFVYGGVIKHMEDGATFVAPNHLGPGGQKIEEKRDLYFFDPFNSERMRKFDNFIQSNTWIMDRNTLLNVTREEDPLLVVAEDVYLYRLMMELSEPRFTFRVAAQWNWRKGVGGNSMTLVDQDTWAAAGTDAHLRLKFFEKNLEFKRSKAFTLTEPNVDYVFHDGFSVDIGSSFLSQCSPSGFFHSVEKGGIWTVLDHASFTIIAHPTESSVFSIYFDVAVSEKNGPKDVEVFLNGERVYFESFDRWGGGIAKFPISPSPEGLNKIEIRCSYLFCPAAETDSPDDRNLGIYLKKLDLEAKNSMLDGSMAPLSDSSSAKEALVSIDELVERSRMIGNSTNRSEENMEDPMLMQKRKDAKAESHQEKFMRIIRYMDWR